MPYIKQNVPYVKMQRLLKGYGLNAPALAKILDCSEPTARKLLNERTSKLTLGDLDRINRFAHIPIEEIRDAIAR